jgi:hypothetical protein
MRYSNIEDLSLQLTNELPNSEWIYWIWKPIIIGKKTVWNQYNETMVHVHSESLQKILKIIQPNWNGFQERYFISQEKKVLKIIRCSAEICGQILSANPAEDNQLDRILENEKIKGIGIRIDLTMSWK